MGNKKRIKQKSQQRPRSKHQQQVAAARPMHTLPDRNVGIHAQAAQANSPANRARVRAYIRECGSPVIAAKGVFNAYAEAGDKAPTGGLQLACRAGCWFCCTIPVAVTVFEAGQVFGVIKQLPEADQERIWTRVQEHVEAQRQAIAASVEKRVDFTHRCPLLTDEGTCSVYDARPLTCRGLLSVDAERCRQAYLEDDNGDPNQPFLASNLAVDAAIPHLMVALNEGGMDHYPNYELISALYALNADPDIFLRWQQGKRFAMNGFPHMAEQGEIFPTPPNLPIG